MSVLETIPSQIQSIPNNIILVGEENFLPDDIVLHIFDYLGRRELSDARLVCQQWHDVANDETLYRIPAKVTVIDRKIWQGQTDLKAYGLSISNASMLSNKTITLFSQKFMKSVNIENDAGITLLTMPKGLTINKLLAIAKKPLKGNSIGCRYIHDSIISQCGDIPIQKEYTIAITNAVLTGSRNKYKQEQSELVQSKGCVMPTLLEMMTLTLLRYVNSLHESPTLLYGDDPSSLSRVEETVYGGNLAVGLFTPAGLYVNELFRSTLDVMGVAGVRHFELPQITFSNLPEEIIEQVFEKLSFSSLSKTILLNHRFSRISHTFIMLKSPNPFLPDHRKWLARYSALERIQSVVQEICRNERKKAFHFASVNSSGFEHEMVNLWSRKKDPLWELWLFWREQIDKPKDPEAIHLLHKSLELGNIKVATVVFELLD